MSHSWPWEFTGLWQGSGVPRDKAHRMSLMGTRDEKDGPLACLYSQVGIQLFKEILYNSESFLAPNV